MNKTYKTITTTIIICITLSLAVCKTGQGRSKTEKSETIKIASFNIQVFGKTKAKKADVMETLASIITGFDIVAIQEIRDKSGTAIKKLEQLVDSRGVDYTCIAGPRLGRSSSKEQYAYLYKTSMFTVLESYTPKDEQDHIHREPFIVHFKYVSASFDFVMVNIHTDPDEAGKEIAALVSVAREAQNITGEKDVIVLGDFNADCSYFDESNITGLFPVSEFLSIIPDSEDTTVKKTVCTYDRIIISSSAKEDYCGYYGVFRFDTLYNLSNKEAAQVSDHYPVWAEFYVDRDGD